jgi:hypothetical protein
MDPHKIFIPHYPHCSNIILSSTHHDNFLLWVIYTQIRRWFALVRENPKKIFVPDIHRPTYHYNLSIRFYKLYEAMLSTLEPFRRNLF